MSDFWSGEFTFNGISSTDMGVTLIDINNKNILKQIGNQYELNLSQESTYNNKIYYKEEQKQPDPITIQICLNDNISKFDVNKILEINNWLFQQNFCRFQTEDYNSEYNIVLYLKAISFSKNLNQYGKGYLEYQFHSYDNYAYIVPSNTSTLADGDEAIINNPSNLHSNYKPIIKVKNLGTETEVITITNVLTGKHMELTSIATNEIITIDCQMATVLNDNNENRFDILNNYNFIELTKGENRITLSGNCEVEFICEFPVIL